MRISSLKLYRFFVGGFPLLYLALFLQFTFQLPLTVFSIVCFSKLYLCGGLIHVLLLNRKAASKDWLVTVGLSVFPAIFGTLVVVLSATKLPAMVLPMIILAVVVCIAFTARLETPQSGESKV